MLRRHTRAGGRYHCTNRRSRNSITCHAVNVAFVNAFAWLIYATPFGISIRERHCYIARYTIVAVIEVYASTTHVLYVITRYVSEAR